MTRDPAKIKASRAREAAVKKARIAADPAYRAHRRDVDRASAQRVRGREFIPPGQQLKSVSLLTDETTGDLTASWTKTEHEAGPVVTPPPDFTMDRVSTMTVAGEPRVQWTSYDRTKADEWTAMWAACKAATEEYKGIADPVPEPMPRRTNRLLNLIPIGDPHVGMLAWARETGVDFDSNIARDDLLRVLAMLFDRSPPAKTCLLMNLGDFFHAEDDEARTPRGNNALDTDSRAGRITRLGYHLMRGGIDLALKRHAKVVVGNLRGNHDPYKSIGLNLYLEGVYEREPRVEILDNNNPFLYYEHGLNLLGFHHGDGAKPEQLPGIMAAYLDGKPWGRASFRKWFTGHIHTRRAHDFPGVSWESCRTLAPGDYWSHWKGYRSEQNLECHTFDTEHGLVSRQNVSLLMARG